VTKRGCRVKSCQADKQKKTENKLIKSFKNNKNTTHLSSKFILNVHGQLLQLAVGKVEEIQCM